MRYPDQLPGRAEDLDVRFMSVTVEWQSFVSRLPASEEDVAR